MHEPNVERVDARGPASVVELAGLRTLVVGDADAPLVIVMLHGREMTADDLAPFGSSLGVRARFVFPDGPLACAPRGRSWWPVDSEARARALQGGPLDLAGVDQPGRAAARAALAALLAEVAPPPTPVVLVGFSQGGMLAMDHVLHADTRPAALALLSSSRVAFTDWQPRLARVRDLPILIAHGRDDAELAFSAGEGLRDAALAGGAAVTWLPFDGRHEIPLVVWRALRRWLATVPTS